MPRPRPVELQPNIEGGSALNYDILSDNRIRVDGGDNEQLVDAAVKIAEGLGQHLLPGEIDSLSEYQSVEVADDFLLEVMEDGLIVMVKDPDNEDAQREMEEVVDEIIGN